jgi:hypothetical protein
VHTVGEPACEEDWLRQHARLVNGYPLQNSEILYFEPQGTETFFPDSSQR